MAKKQRPFAIGKDGRKYVRASAIMHPLCYLVDGLSLVFFGKDRRHAYLTLDDAIAWAEREGEHHDRGKYATIVAALVRFRDTPDSKCVDA